jgi:hypothetical protein
LIIKPFDNQAFWDAWWLSWLFRLQNVYSQIKQYRLKPLSKTISQPAPSPPSSYQPPDTVDYLRFLYVSWSCEDSFVITSRQRRIDWCLQCAFQGLVFLTSLMTSSVRKASLTIGLCVWQGTLMSTKRMSLGCGDSSMVALHLEAG